MRTPIQRSQAVEAQLVAAIEQGRYPIGSRLPSVLQAATYFGCAAKTIHKAYRALSKRGIVKSVPRKGYYVTSLRTAYRMRVFLLLDNYSSYKRSLFQTIKKGFGEEVDLSVRFHLYDEHLFRRYIAENLHQFHYYILSPFFMEELEGVLDQLPAERLYLLGRHPRSLTKEYHGVFQDFRTDVMRSLAATGDQLWHYDRITLCFKDSVTRPPRELAEGFAEFCKDRQIEHRIVRQAAPPKIQPQEAYLLIDDEDLIDVVQQARSAGYRLGEEVGLISYNDAPIKSIIAQDGVSVISTDFEAMGRSIVEMVLGKAFEHRFNPCYFIDRGTF